MPSDQYDKKYAADDQAISDKVHHVLSYVVPGYKEALAAQPEIEKTKAGKQASQFVQEQLAHPEQMAIGGVEGESTGLNFDGIIGHMLEKPTPEATVAVGGTGAASSEELARPDVFVKYSKSGEPTYLGKSPDANLKPGEAIIAVNKRTGEVRVQNTHTRSDSDALAKFGPHAKKNWGSIVSQPKEQTYELSGDEPTPKDTIEGQGLVYKGELTSGSKVHMFEHPDHIGKTAAMHEDEGITSESVKTKMDSKLKEFGVK
jgi:hypothetical protein